MSEIYKPLRWSFKFVDKVLSEVIGDLMFNVDRRWRAYYIGGSLCIDFDFHPNVILNRNGRGFFYNFKDQKIGTEVKFVMTEKMKIKVNQIYDMHRKAEDERRK